MIEFFKVWTEGIIVVVFLSIIVEFLLHESKYKKIVNIVTNIYLIFVILNPILNIDEIELKEIYEERKIEDVASIDLDKVTKEIFKENLTEEIIELDNVIDAEVNVLESGEIKNIKIKVADINKKEKVKAVISEKYGISIENILVEEIKNDWKVERSF